MARGPKKHLKRLHAPKHWMLDKLGGIFAPRPSSGPHKLRECLPLNLILRNRLKYALTGREVKSILQNRHVKVDGKVRTDVTFPAGFMDVITMDASGDKFRLLYDTKGRFTLHRITPEQAKFKLCKVKRVEVGDKAVPYLVTHDGRTFRFPNPDIKVNDTVKLDLEKNEIVSSIKLHNGALCMVTGGHNIGRVGELIKRESHDGGFDMAYIRDRRGHEFATRLSNVFIIGEHGDSLVSLPKAGGVRLSIM
eukprot:EC817078.1.p2 GENE.EC817078.1~~EC817078.1.p2  ORF type:complete len:250 (+),score=121.67 EC817078.1:25-774(+)